MRMLLYVRSIKKEFAAKTQPSHAINSSKFIPFHGLFIEFIFVGFPFHCSGHHNNASQLHCDDKMVYKIKYDEYKT